MYSFVHSGVLDFNAIIREINAVTPQELFLHFKEERWNAWIDEYLSDSFGYSGEITCQGFWGGFQFIIDHTSDWEPADYPKSNLPEDRVVAAFGLSTVRADDQNKTIMQSFRKGTNKLFERYGAVYNRGHLIAHSMGGPIDVNLFPQLEHVNLGRSPEGSKYRKMERYITAHPGTFVFSRPIYGDFSECPFAFEYGYCDADMKMITETFPNRP